VLPQILRLDLRGHIAAGEREGKGGRKREGRKGTEAWAEFIRG